MAWKDDQVWEAKWHGDCVNSYWEETKQIVYARKMGLTAMFHDGKYPTIDLKGLSVCDIGSGAYSLLLKTLNGKDLVAVDPLDYPAWTRERYKAHGITPVQAAAELYKPNRVFDEVWMYNCLQHTMDPKKILKNIKAMSKLIRIFEWIEEPISIGHPNTLHAADLDKILGGTGKTEYLNENGCVGQSYSGVFLGDHYEKV